MLKLTCDEIFDNFLTTFGQLFDNFWTFLTTFFHFFGASQLWQQILMEHILYTLCLLHSLVLIAPGLRTIQFLFFPEFYPLFVGFVYFNGGAAKNLVAIFDTLL
jgi:hypothetical protein